MIRTVALALAAAIDVHVGRFFAQAAAPSTDPIELLKSLGVGALVAVPVYLWQRDTAKQRDKAMDQLAAQTEAIRQNTEAQRAVAAAVNDITRRSWDRER